MGDVNHFTSPCQRVTLDILIVVGSRPTGNPREEFHPMPQNTFDSR